MRFVVSHTSFLRRGGLTKPPVGLLSTTNHVACAFRSDVVDIGAFVPQQARQGVVEMTWLWGRAADL